MDIIKQNNDNNIVQLVNSNEFADYEQLTDDTPQPVDGTAVANTQANSLERKEHFVTGGTNSLSVNKNINVKSKYYSGWDRLGGIPENLSEGTGELIGHSGKAIIAAIILGHKLTETANLGIKFLSKLTSVVQWTPTDIKEHNKLMAKHGAAVAMGYFWCGLSLLLLVCIFIFVHSLIYPT